MTFALISSNFIGSRQGLISISACHSSLHGVCESFDSRDAPGHGKQPIRTPVNADDHDHFSARRRQPYSHSTRGSTNEINFIQGKKLKVGVASHNNKDAYASGRRVASKALENGGLDRPDLVFAFCHGDLNHEEFLSGLRSITGPRVPIVGGSAIGIISNDDISYENYPSGAAFIQSNSLRHEIVSVTDLGRDEILAGKKLGEKITCEPPAELLLVFYDSIKKPPEGGLPPLLNASTHLIDGIEQGLQKKLSIIGSGLVGDYALGPTKQFCGTSLDSRCVVGIALSGRFKHYCKIMHGCNPLDGVYRKITKMEGSIVYELDHKPIVDIIDGLFGNEDWKHENPSSLLTLGINHGEKYAPPREEQYVNRLIAGVLPDGKGISLFEPDLLQGEEVQFMLRDISMIQESARKNTAELMDRIRADGTRPVWGLYIDCAGRASDYLNTPNEEAAEVQKVFNENKTPLLGFYSGVEIAPFLDKSRGLDWTGVLLVFGEEPGL